MTHVMLQSEDRALQAQLESTLGSEFQIHPIQDDDDLLNTVEECDVVLVDLNSNREAFLECIQSARRIVGAQIPCVLLVDEELRATAEELVSLGAFGFCRRPPSIRDLRVMLGRAQEEFFLKKQLVTVQTQREAVTGCDRLVGSSIKMQQIYKLVKSVANLNVSVLITGQSGTGKELVARAIHNQGARSGRPFVAVACGAIPESLIEAELFGHEKGASAGTVGVRAGYFEQAGEGTIFLDEIGELSLLTQVKLLRVLQDREFYRVGSSRPIPLRARLVVATNRNLAEMIEQGRFRQDLYYRINVVKIETPALREHVEDIPRIAMHFLRHYSQIFQKHVESFDPDAIALLKCYPWPGNVRELENAIQRAIVLASGETIRVLDLPLHPGDSDAGANEVILSSRSFEDQIHDFKLWLAKTAIREHRGNKTLAARSLCISRAYLHRLIRASDPIAGLEQVDDENESECSPSGEIVRRPQHSHR